MRPQEHWKAPSPEALQKRCDEWNAAHPIGSEVWYHPVISDEHCLPYPTRIAASVLSGHTCVVFLDGKAGCVALDAITDSPNQRRPTRAK